MTPNPTNGMWGNGSFKKNCCDECVRANGLIRCTGCEALTGHGTKCSMKTGKKAKCCVMDMLVPTLEVSTRHKPNANGVIEECPRAIVYKSGGDEVLPPAKPFTDEPSLNGRRRNDCLNWTNEQMRQWSDVTGIAFDQTHITRVGAD